MAIGIARTQATHEISGAFVAGMLAHGVPGPKDEPIDDHDMDPRTDDPDPAHGPRHDRGDADRPRDASPTRHRSDFLRVPPRGCAL